MSPPASWSYSSTSTRWRGSTPARTTIPARITRSSSSAGRFRRELAFSASGSAGGRLHATFFFLADLGPSSAGGGPGSTRVPDPNLEAGLIGGRLYLAAYAQGFGATGLTFYDRAVVEFFSPASAGLDALFVTALGRSASSKGAAPAQAGLLRPRVIC